MAADLPARVLFGAAYYHEYHLHERLKQDLDLMSEAHFSVIRVGESVWSTWEPEDGVFDLDWLQPVLDGAAERGIGVILGTPTYAAPPWLQRKYPEIAAEDATGRRVPWGARQEIDYTHPAFRFHAERVIRRVVERYAGHSAVIGFQVDNEPGLHLFHNRGVFEGFRDWLRHSHGTEAALNARWGLTYWSHRLSTWEELWRPDGNTLPQYDLAWRRYQAALTTEFIAWQARIVREYARPEQFVTTCIAYSRPGIEDRALTAPLDVTAGNPYYAMQDGLEKRPGTAPAQGWSTTGTWALFRTADRMYSSRQEPYLVTETDAASIGGSHMNFPAFDGQWRQAAWALIARGARMVEYWHWHTLHFGPEAYWGGVLPHSLEPGRVYRQIAQLGSELETAGDLVVDAVPDSDVTLLYSPDSLWSFTFEPPFADQHGGPDRSSYLSAFDAFYRGAFDAGLQVRILHADALAGQDPAELAEQHRVLVVAGLYIADDALLDLLAAYAYHGGHLVLGVRTGYADEAGVVRAEAGPPRLIDAAGVRYQEFSNLAAPVPVLSPSDGPLALAASAAATRWVDGLEVLDAQVLAGYDHQHFARWPAITSRSHGRGRVTYVGTVPDEALARSLASWLVPQPVAGWGDVPATATVTSGRGADGRRLWFAHNWSWQPCTLPAHPAVLDVLSGDRLAADSGVPLGAWDIRVFVSDEAPAHGG